MDQTQLELDLQVTTEKILGLSASVVSLQLAREERKRKVDAKLYEAILESVDHITVPQELLYK